jgi:hypothetical protein
MSRQSAVRFAVTAVTMSLGAVSFALAPPGTIVQSNVIGPTPILTDAFFETASEPVFEAEFDLFDPAVGTLTDVTVEIESEFSISGRGSAVFGSVYTEFYGGIAWQELVFQEVYIQKTIQTVAPGQVFSEPIPFNRTLEVPVDAFIGVGTGKLRTPSFVVGHIYVVANANMNATLALEHMTMRLTYAYEPIPEPAGSLMGGVGALALAAVHRVRRRRAAAEFR